MTQVQKAFQVKEDLDWINKTRTLIVSSRGMTAAQRTFMLELFSLLPHSKKQCKLQKDNVHQQIKQLCEVHKCRYFLFFQVKKKIHFSLWIGRYPDGPSVKLDLSGIVLNRDIKFQGNCVKGARHILSFDHNMESNGKLKVLKNLFTGAFNIPKRHPKSTAVIDHVLNFTCQDDQVSFRSYQIFRQAVSKQKDKLSLYEIGPRFLMDVNCILDGVLCGQVLYRAAVFKKIKQKNKTDKRKRHSNEPHQIKPINQFGEQQLEE